MRRLGPALASALRSLRIWGAVLQLLAFLWWDAQSWSYPGGVSEERQERRQKRRARWLTAQLLELGSAFIKLGQLLSARPDVLPASWVEELSRLQDSVPAFSFETAQALLEQARQQNQAQPLDRQLLLLAAGQGPAPPSHEITQNREHPENAVGDAPL